MKHGMECDQNMEGVRTYHHVHIQLTHLTHPPTPVWREDVDNTPGCMGQEYGPVEAEHHDDQKGCDGDTHHWLYGGHTSAY